MQWCRIAALQLQGPRIGLLCVWSFSLCLLSVHVGYFGFSCFLPAPNSMPVGGQPMR